MNKRAKCKRNARISFRFRAKVPSQLRCRGMNKRVASVLNKVNMMALSMDFRNFATL